MKTKHRTPIPKFLTQGENISCYMTKIHLISKKLLLHITNVLLNSEKLLLNSKKLLLHFKKVLLHFKKVLLFSKKLLGTFDYQGQKSRSVFTEFSILHSLPRQKGFIKEEGMVKGD